MSSQTRYQNGQYGPAIKTAPEVAPLDIADIEDTPLFPADWDENSFPQASGEVSLAEPENWPAPPF